ncbi:MAG: 5-oxoprolinase subunit PxpA [Deltaproteobacteria bacterium]|nr:5-oxoprolinase subunit PxpA [Deltaproteobacteria bacterium]
MLKQIDLNSDVGESFGAYKIGLDEAVIPLISSANIACGFHAGDPLVMAKTISLAAENDVGLGAHPGLPDLMGFGRRVMDVSLEEIRHYVTYQVGALQAFATQRGLSLQHVKPHGALYNMAVRDTEISNAIAEVISGLDENLILVALAGPNRDDLVAIAKRHSIRIAFEFFADRAYNPDGSLVSRKIPGAVLHDDGAVAERIIKLVETGTVAAIDSTEIDLKADTICVHGDNPEALALVKKTRTALTDSGIRVRPMGVFL